MDLEGERNAGCEGDGDTAVLPGERNVEMTTFSCESNGDVIRGGHFWTEMNNNSGNSWRGSEGGWRRRAHSSVTCSFALLHCIISHIIRLLSLSLHSPRLCASLSSFCPSLVEEMEGKDRRCHV